MAVAKALASQPDIDQQTLTQINTVLQQEASQPNFDIEILQPLRAQQEAERIRSEQAAEAQRVAAENARLAYLASIRDRMKPYGTYGNSYAGGNCTWYVASRIPVPSYMGNARYWAGGLGAAGWTVSGVPQVGAIAQTTAGWAGHVAVVEAVNSDGSVTVSEMNYQGLGVISMRTTSVYDWTYIY